MHKKTFGHFIVAALLSTAAINPVQGQVYFEEDFQQGIPGSFTLINVDGLTPFGNVAYVTDAWVAREDFNVAGDTVATSTSYYSPAGQSDDWLVTPAIALGAQPIMNWEAYAPDAGFADGYEVYVSTTGATQADFLSSAPVFAIAAENSVWTPRSVDLSAYEDTTVWVAFRNNSIDKFLLQIDDISILANNISNDAEIVALNLNEEYTALPIAFNPELQLSATISNLGFNDLTGVHFVADVFNQAGTAVASGLMSNVLPTLVSGGSAQLSVPQAFLPSTPDQYTVRYIVMSDSADGVAENDTAFTEFEITLNEIRRDDGLITGSLGIGAGPGLGSILGQNFEFTETAELASAAFFLNNPNAGDTVFADVYSFDSVPNTILATTQKYVVTTADELGVLLTLPLEGAPLSVAAGETIFIGVRETNATISLATTNQIFTPQSTWINWATNPTGGWSNSEDFGFDVAYVLRAMLTEPDSGCTDPSANNYDPNAGIDDGTCLYGPANDLCSNASVIVCGDILAGSTVDASLDSLPTCGVSITAAGVWYVFEGTGDAVTASLCDSANFDTKMSVFSGACGSLVCIDGNDDDCDLISRVSFASEVGTNYYILVHGFGSEEGNFLLSLACQGAPANDECSGALPIDCSAPVSGSTDFATTASQPTATCGTNPESPGVWYVFNGGGESVTLDLCGTNYDTKLNVYEGDCNNLVCVGGNDDFCDVQSAVTFTATAGTDYYILVNGWNGETGDFTLNIACELPCTPVPANDDCATAEMISFGSGGLCTPITRSNECATPATAPNTCDEFGVIQDVWFKFNSGSNTMVDYELTALTTSSPLQIGLYDSCGGAIMSCLSTSSTLSNSWTGLDSNSMYWVQVWNSGGNNAGTFSLCISEEVACPPVVGLNATNVTTETALLNWDCDPTAQRHFLRGGRVGSGRTDTLKRLPGCRSPKRVGRLEAGEAYWWQVLAICDTSIWETAVWSNRDTFWTPCLGPDTNWTNNITATAATLNWSPVAEALGYEVKGGPIGNSRAVIPVPGDGSTTSFNTGDILAPGTAYEWKVRAICQGEVPGLFSSTGQFTTGAAKNSPALETLTDAVSLKMHPNPTAGTVTIQLDNVFHNELSTLSITDLNGKTVYRQIIAAETLIDGKQICTSNWAAGIYQVNLVSRNLRTTQKLMVH